MMETLWAHVFSCKFHTLWRHKLIPLLQFGFSNYSNILHKHFLWLDVCVHTHLPRSCLGCPPCLFCLWVGIWLPCVSTSTRDAQRKLLARLLQG